MPGDSSVKRHSLPLLIPVGQHARSQPIKLERPIYVIGSKDQCRIRLVSTTISRVHALLVQTRHLTYIRDLCSRTHVFVNGRQIKESVLHDGDLIAIGKFTFKYQGPKRDHGAEPTASPAALEVDGAELPIPIEQYAMLIGRRPISDIPLLEESVSSAHAVIFSWEGKRFLRDLWSRTGTFVNGHKVHEQELKPGDIIRAGETDIRYAASLEEAAFAAIEDEDSGALAAAPSADEMDLNAELEPAKPAVPSRPAVPVAAANMPLELTPPAEATEQPQDTLGLEPLEAEQAPADEPLVPLALDQPLTPAAEDENLPRRGWRSAVAETGEAEVSSPQQPHEQETPLSLEAFASAAPVLGSELTPPAEAPAEAEAPLPVAAAPKAEEPAPPAPQIDLSAANFNDTVPEAAEDIDDVLGLADTTSAKAPAEFVEAEAPLLPLDVSDDAAAEPLAETTKSEVIEPTQPTPQVAADIDDVLGLADTTSAKAPEESVAEAPLLPLDLSEEAASAPAAEVPSPEVIEPTQPTPESALDLPVAEETKLEAAPSPADLTDTTFGRNIEEFEGESLGPIIETPAIEAEQILPAVEAPAPPIEHVEPAPSLALNLASDSSETCATIDASSIPQEPPSQEIEEIEPLQLADDDVFGAVDSIDQPTSTDQHANEDVSAVPPPLELASPLVADESQTAVEELSPLAAEFEQPEPIVNIAPEAPAMIEVPSPTVQPPEMPEALNDLPIFQPAPVAEAVPLSGLSALADASNVPPQSMGDHSAPAADFDAPLLPANLDTPSGLAALAELQQSSSQHLPSDDEFLSHEPLDVAPMIQMSSATETVPLTGLSSLIESAPSIGSEIERGIDSPPVELPPAIAPEPIVVVNPPQEASATLDASSLPVDAFQANIAAPPAIEPEPEPLDEPILLDDSLTVSSPEDTAMLVLPAAQESGQESAPEPIAEVPHTDVPPPLESTHKPLAFDAAAINEPAPQQEKPNEPLDVALDLSQISPADDTIAPLDDELALDFLSGDQAPVEPTTLVPPADTIHATVDQTVAVPVAEPPYGSLIEQAPAAPEKQETTEAPTLADEQATQTHDVLSPEADDTRIDSPIEPPVVAPSSEAPPVVELPPVESPALEEPGAEIPLTSIKPPPPIRPRRGARSRVIRNGFGQDPSAPKAGAVEIPPFSDATPGLGATLGGLSMPAVREADVFSELAQPGREAPGEGTGDVFSESSSRAIFAEEVAKSMPTAGLTDLGDSGAPAADVFAPQTRPRPRGGRLSASLPPGPKPVIALGSDDADHAAAERRRKLMRRAPILMIIMLLLMGGAWAATYFIIPKRARIQATLNYGNFSSLTQAEQRKFQADQLDRLRQESTRNLAMRMLQNRYPATPAGFLANPDEYLKLINPETRWKDQSPEDKVGHFVIRYDGTDQEDDIARVEAVALALYDSNSRLASETMGLRQTLDRLKADIETKQRQIKELKDTAEHARAVFDARPSKAQLDQLKADDAALDATYTQAINAAKSAQADVDQLKKQQQDQAAPANGNADPILSDNDIKKLTQDADVLSTRLAAARKERAELASKARATLDSAYDEFKKQVETSGDVTKNNPELAAYVKSAQDLQSAIADLTDNYIKRQQDEYTELNRFKSQVEAKIKERKADQMANDPKLKELAESKEVKERQYNAAKGSGLTQEAEGLQADLKLIDASLKAQQEVIANDPVFNELITGLQKMIDDKQRSIDDERKKTDQKLASLKSAFAKSAPTVEKLPAEQKELAAAMQERLAQIDAARKQYAEAADASAADADTSIKRMNDELQQLQTNIELRKKQILASNNEASRKARDDERNAALAQKTEALDAAGKALADARTKYDANHTKLLQAVAINDEAARTAEKLDQANRDRDTLERQLQQNLRDAELKQQQYSRAVEPIEPTADSVTLIGDPKADHREQWLKYAGISSGGIFLFFAVWILMTLISASRESHHAYTPPIETLETPALPKENGKAVNGSSETEEEPAVA